MSKATKKVIVPLMITLLLVLISGVSYATQNSDEECCLYMKPGYCPPRYTSFTADKDIYERSDLVTLTLWDLQEDYLIEELTIKEVLTGDVVFHTMIDEPVPVDVTEWTYQWDQIGNSGSKVDYGHYFALVETRCCGIYRTNFRTQFKPKPCPCCTCCGKRFAKVFSHSSKYLVGDPVNFTFTNPKEGCFIFDRLAIKRCSGCCGCKTVYSYVFPDGTKPGPKWSWTWDQTDKSGNHISTGTYSLVIETENCGQFSTKFEIYQRRTCGCGCCGCCSFWNFFCSCGCGCGCGDC